MYGIVSHYDRETQSGLILGVNDELYEFTLDGWRSGGEPVQCEQVEFSLDGKRALAISRRSAGAEPAAGPDDLADGLGLNGSFDWQWFLLSPQGRIPRSWFWLRWIVPSVVVMTLLFTLLTAAAIRMRSGPLVSGSEAEALLMRCLLILQVIFIWPTLCVQIKRLQDRGRSGWLAYGQFALSVLLAVWTRLGADFMPPLLHGLVVLDGLYAVWLFVETGFLPGTPGPNRYGRDPLERR